MVDQYLTHAHGLWNSMTPRPQRPAPRFQQHTDSITHPVFCPLHHCRTAHNMTLPMTQVSCKEPHLKFSYVV